jgi:4-amino-4-deoxy-L-arabinose transferase-like glycosyltransferase
MCDGCPERRRGGNTDRVTDPFSTERVQAAQDAAAPDYESAFATEVTRLPKVGFESEEAVHRESIPIIGGSVRPRSFGLALFAIAVGALLLRVSYVLAYTRYRNGTLYDSFWYYSTTIGLHLGWFFRVPFSFSPTAAHPPMTTLLLGAGTYLIGLHRGMTSSLLVMAFLGSAVVVCVGLLGRAVAGPWIGLIAAIVAALSPNFWMPSGILMSETPAMLFMALVLLAVVHLLRSPTLVAAVLLGVGCGALALVRAELILCVPGLLIPAALLVKLPLRRRFLLLGAGLAATTLVLAPWVGRNLATFQDPTYLSTGNGLVLLGANCQQTYSGPDIGLWSAQCAMSVRGGGDESVQSTRNQHAAVQYVEHHSSRIPIVVLARIAREWDVYKPVQMAQAETGEGRPYGASLAGLAFNYALLPFGVAGIVILRRRRIDQWFLLVPAGIVTLASALFFALVRFRAPFEVCLAVLAAPSIVLLVERLRGGGASEPTHMSLRRSPRHSVQRRAARHSS